MTIMVSIKKRVESEGLTAVVDIFGTLMQSQIIKIRYKYSDGFRVGFTTQWISQLR
jgi:hypothetical protein